MLRLHKTLQNQRKAVYCGAAARVSENLFEATTEAWKKAELRCRPMWQELQGAADVPSCQPLRQFYEKYPFASRILTTPRAIPGSLATLCKPGQPHKGIENLDVLASVLFCVGRLGQRNSSWEIKRKQVHLTNAALMLYLSQRFHCYVEQKPSETREPGVPLGDTGQINAVVLVGDLFITELYSQLSKLNDNFVAEIMSENLAHFSQDSFLDFSAPPRLVAGCFGEPFPAVGAVKMFFTTVLVSSGALAKATEQVQQDMADLGDALGGLYYTHVSLLNVLKGYCRMRTVEDEMNMLDLATTSKENIISYFEAMEMYRERSRTLIRQYDTQPIAIIAIEALLEFLGCSWLRSIVLKNV